jgi:hypothetical protein
MLAAIRRASSRVNNPRRQRDDLAFPRNVGEGHAVAIDPCLPCPYENLALRRRRWTRVPRARFVLICFLIPVGMLLLHALLVSN